MIDEPIILLNTDLSVVLGMTYGFLPFAILPLYVSIDRLDDSLVAAARDLYASGRQAFQHVTLPLTMPGIIAAAILTFIPAIGDYVTPDLLGGAQTTTIAKVVQTQFLSARDWPSGAALGFLLMLVTIVGTLRQPADPAPRGALSAPGTESVADGLRDRGLRVPVPADRDPDPVLVQRLEAQLRVARLHAALVPAAVRATRTCSTRCSSRSRSPWSR